MLNGSESGMALAERQVLQIKGETQGTLRQNMSDEKKRKPGK